MGKAKLPSKKTRPQTQLGKIVDQRNDRYVSKIMKERTSSSIFHEHCTSVYTFINDDDEMHMNEIVSEQKVITASYQTPARNLKIKNGIPIFKVDPNDDYDDEFNNIIDESDGKIDSIDPILTPPTIKRKIRKKKKTIIYKEISPYKRTEAGKRDHPLYERHVEWQKERKPKQYNHTDTDRLPAIKTLVRCKNNSKVGSAIGLVFWA